MMSASKRLLKRLLPKTVVGTLAYWLNGGNTTYSQFGEDIWVNRLLDGPTGFYVDIGSFHPKFASNTYRLNRRGWRGINIDVDEYKIRLFNRFRKGDTNLVAGVSSQTTTLPFYFKSTESYGSESSFEREFVEERDEKGGAQLTMREVAVTTLDDILATHLPARDDGSKIVVDFVNIDVEGHEQQILECFDFDRFKPRCFCIEIHADTLDELHANATFRLMYERGYVLRAWPQPSCIFVRRDQASPQSKTTRAA